MARRRKRQPLGNFRQRANVYNKNTTPQGRYSSTRGYPVADSVATFYGSLYTISADDDWLGLNLERGDKPSHTFECRDEASVRTAGRSTVVEIVDHAGRRFFDVVGRRPLNERGERVILLLRLIEDDQEFLNV